MIHINNAINKANIKVDIIKLSLPISKTNNHEIFMRTAVTAAFGDIDI